MTVRKIEAADPGGLASQTLRRLDHALNWRPGTAQAIADGFVTGEELDEAITRPAVPPGRDMFEDLPGQAAVGRASGAVVRPGTAAGTGAANDPTVDSLAAAARTLMQRLATEARWSPAVSDATIALARLVGELEDEGPASGK